MKLNTSSLLYAAGIAGVVAGIGSSAPILGLFNCLLCGWFWAGGAAAVYLYNKKEAQSLDIGKGLLIGALTGLIAIVVGAALGIALSSVGFSSVDLSTIQNDPELAPYLDQIGGAEGFVAIAAGLGLICSLSFGVVFGALGGLLGSAIFKKKTA